MRRPREGNPVIPARCSLSRHSSLGWVDQSSMSGILTHPTRSPRIHSTWPFWGTPTGMNHQRVSEAPETAHDEPIISAVSSHVCCLARMCDQYFFVGARHQGCQHFRRTTHSPRRPCYHIIFTQQRARADGKCH